MHDRHIISQRDINDSYLKIKMGKSRINKWEKVIDFKLEFIK
jgi:hypothetical protein